MVWLISAEDSPAASTAASSAAPAAAPAEAGPAAQTLPHPALRSLQLVRMLQSLWLKENKHMNNLLHQIHTTTDQ